MVSPHPLRLSGAALGAGLLIAGLTGCGGSGTDTQCSTTSCTVTFDRGVDAEASILGVSAELVRVRDQQATLRVAGQTVTVPVGGSKQGGDFTVAVREITADSVVVKVALAGGG